MISPPVIKISSQVTIHKKRYLDQPGKALVRAGMQVQPDDVLAVGHPNPEYTILDISNALGISQAQATQQIVCRQGSPVEKGDLLAGPVGFSQRVVRSPSDGVIALINNHLVVLKKKRELIPLKAGISGEVVELIEGRGAVIQTSGTLLQGLWGNGKTSYGNLKVIPDEPTLEKLTSELIDNNIHQIYYYSQCAGEATLDMLEKLNPEGLVLGSLHPGLIQRIDRSPYPVLALNGFGQSAIDPRITDLLQQHGNQQVSLFAEKWDQYKETRPELIIPIPGMQDAPATDVTRNFKIGQEVRLNPSPRQGSFGTIVDFKYNYILGNGIRADTAIVQFADSEQVIVPLANIIVLD